MGANLWNLSHGVKICTEENVLKTQYPLSKTVKKIDVNELGVPTKISIRANVRKLSNLTL